jgi:hypothetical protein
MTASTPHGLYYGHAALSQLGYPFATARELLEKHGTRVESRHGGKFKNIAVSRSATPPPLDEVLPLLTLGHEIQHYAQYMSTTTGLLLWRTLAEVVSTGAYLIGVLDEVAQACEGEADWTPPLRDWLETIDLPQLAQWPQWPAARIYKTRPQLDALIRFLESLTDDANLTMAEFVTLANDARDVLAERHDVARPSRWAARTPTLDSYLPERRLTLNEILEGAARIHERRTLAAFGYGVHALREWETRFVNRAYEPVYRWLMEELVDPTLALVAVDIALCGPMDILCRQEGAHVVYVEDTLPSWRLETIVETMRREFWPAGETEREVAANEGIAQLAGIPTPSASLGQALATAISGPNSWGADARARGVDVEASELAYIWYAEKELQRGMKIRLAKPLHFASPGGEFFQPLICVYDDTLVLSGSPREESTWDMYFYAVRTLMNSLAVVELLFGDGDGAELTKIARCLHRRLQQQAGGDETELYDPTEFAKAVLGPPMADRMRF